MTTFSFYETVTGVCHARSRQRWLSFVSLDPKSMSRSRKVAWVDGGLALIYAALFGGLIRASNEAAADAIRRYGHNVDSGALELISAVV